MQEEKEMEKQDKERRVYTKEFKAEVAALARKHEKPVSRIAQDLGINENQVLLALQEEEGIGFKEVIVE
jgi:transposase-like protein